MSVCGLIQSPVPVLMMASTCCFNVTAGSPSIPHWLWLPSTAGSTLCTTLQHSSSAASISLHFHLRLLSPLISTMNLPCPFLHKTFVHNHVLQYLTSNVAVQWVYSLITLHLSSIVFLSRSETNSCVMKVTDVLQGFLFFVLSWNTFEKNQYKKVWSICILYYDHDRYFVWHSVVSSGHFVSSELIIT